MTKQESKPGEFLNKSGDGIWITRGGYTAKVEKFDPEKNLYSGWIFDEKGVPVMQCIWNEKGNHYLDGRSYDLMHARRGGEL